MDEAKKKYLEELRKQIDPEILAKMADHLGATTDSAPPARPPASSTNAADLIRERRALQFQERIARKKREIMTEGEGGATKEEAEPFKQTVLILSGTEIWTRIVDSQFKALGFTRSESFAEFVDLVRHLMGNIKDGGDASFVVAVAFQEIRNFIYSWESLRSKREEQQSVSVLDDVPFFLVVESPRQVQPNLEKVYGPDRFLCITDEPELNREKVGRAIPKTAG